MQILLNLKYAIFKMLCQRVVTSLELALYLEVSISRRTKELILFLFTYIVKVYHIYPVKYNLQKQNCSHKTLLRGRRSSGMIVVTRKFLVDSKMFLLLPSWLWLSLHFQMPFTWVSNLSINRIENGSSVSLRLDPLSLVPYFLMHRLNILFHV